MGDVTELGKLVQLVLGCAVSCEKKQGKLCAVKGKKMNENQVDAAICENNTQDQLKVKSHGALYQSWPDHHKIN